jgi:heat-inducible transcriptional repressor
MMTQLSKRQEIILGLIVREYVKTASPIGSKTLVDRYGLTSSSATIRNDMAVLEELGLINAPHTSAGRIPTEAGYRYFVQRLINDTELSDDELRMIGHQFHQARTDVRQWLQLAASVLAQTVRTASVVTAPTISSARFKHLELISTTGRQVLMILVLDRGDVRQQMLTLAEPVAQDTLSEVAGRINAKCVGDKAEDVRSKDADKPALDQEIMELAADLLERADRRHETIYTDGLMNMLDPTHIIGQFDQGDGQEQDEMNFHQAQADFPGARQALRLLEEQSLLEEVLNEALLPDVQGVQVMIAGEGRWEELNHTSMVLSKYGIVGRATGALAVLGPTRLHYGRAISAVRYVAGLMNDLMIDIYGDAQPQ